jgi:hypothetical protein
MERRRVINAGHGNVSHQTDTVARGLSVDCMQAPRTLAGFSKKPQTKTVASNGSAPMALGYPLHKAPRRLAFPPCRSMITRVWTVTGTTPPPSASPSPRRPSRSRPRQSRVPSRRHPQHTPASMVSSDADQIAFPSLLVARFRSPPYIPLIPRPLSIASGRSQAFTVQTRRQPPAPFPLKRSKKVQGAPCFH